MRSNAARDYVAAREGTTRIEQTLMVHGRARRIDVFPEGPIRMGIETKVGRTSLKKDVRRQLAREVKLFRSKQLETTRWEFFKSKVKGEVGPTGPLLDKLEKLGIDVAIYSDISF